MYGKAQARELLAQNWRAFPDLTFGTVGVSYVGSDGLRAAFHRKSSGTHLGPIDPPGFPATGKPIDVDGVDLHEDRDGKIARLRIISNMNDVAVQLGLLPAPAAERRRHWQRCEDSVHTCPRPDANAGTPRKPQLRADFRGAGVPSV